MPYMKVKQGNQWCIYKQDAAKNPVGKSLGCHPIESDADKQLGALYATMKREGEMMDSAIRKAAKK